MYYRHFIHSLVDGHLDCFSVFCFVFAIFNKTSIASYWSLHMDIFSLPFRESLREQLLDHMMSPQLHSFHMLARSCSKSFKWALQQYVNQELPNGGEFRKDRRTRDQFANSIWIIEKAREFQKTICFIHYTKAFDCVDHNKLWKILQVMGIPDHRCLLRNLYVGQETTVRTECGHRLVPNWERGSSRLCIVTLLIQLICREHHVKCWAGWSTSWNQDCWEKYQQHHACRWYHPYGRKWRRTKEPLEEGERREWKSWLKIQPSKILRSLLLVSSLHGK